MVLVQLVVIHQVIPEVWKLFTRRTSRFDQWGVGKCRFETEMVVGHLRKLTAQGLDKCCCHLDND